MSQNPFIFVSSDFLLCSPMSDNVRLQAWQLQNLRQAFVQNATSHPLAHVERSIQKLQELIEVLRHDLNLDAFKRRKLRSSLTVRQFQSRCAKLRHKCKKLQAEVDLIEASRASAACLVHIGLDWLHPISLRSPSVSCATTLWLRKVRFSPERASPMQGMPSQRKSKEVMLQSLPLRLQQICRVNQEEPPAIVVSHLHDEASLKLRSFDLELVGWTLRARCSKVQNEVVHVKFPSGKTVEYFAELQPLLKKDSDTIAQAIENTAKNVILLLLDQPATKPSQPLRLIYILTGDGINTSLTSAKKIFLFFAQNASFLPRRTS